MKLGITATRDGLTEEQLATFIRFIHEREPAELHHGACVGGDEQMVRTVRNTIPKCRIIAHPGVGAGGDRSHRSETAIELSDEIQPEQTHFARNRQIVTECDELFGAPKQMSRPGFGGTWYTIHQGSKAKKPTHICWPDGTVTLG